MELSVMNKYEKNDAETDKVAEKTQEGSAHVAVEGGERATLSRFNPSVLITDAMMWHPPKNPTRRRPHNQSPYSGPTWGHLFWQIIVGVIETLIPLAFIVGIIYWKAPWLFWAVVHYLRGEPVFRF